MSTGTQPTPDDPTDISTEDDSASPAPIHRDDDGDPLAVSVVLSPTQINALDVPADADTVQPVVRDGQLHLDPTGD